MSDYKTEILRYFAQKADYYDLVEDQIYWNLSDSLLWYALKSYAISKLPKKFDFLDAGGGTGRWTLRILEEFPISAGWLYDLSKDMLMIAKKKQKNLKDRWSIIQGDLQNMHDINDDQFDLTFNFHNVLGFIDSPLIAIKEMTRVTRTDGYLVSFIPNLYHTVYFNLTNGQIDEAERTLMTRHGKFTNDMPYLKLFTPASIKELYRKAGLRDIEVIGFPVSIYPGYDETQLEGSTQQIVDILGSKENFQKIFEIEKALLQQPEVAARGNNLFVWGRT